MSRTIIAPPKATIDKIFSLIQQGMKYEVLSLGGGVQSSALWLMNLKGLIQPRADLAVFADTMNERNGTYTYLDYLDKMSIKAGFPPVMRISAGDILHQTRNVQVDIPFWTDSNKGGKRGQLNRQCTGKFKIAVINREIRKIFGMKKRVQWIGFSMDEIHRRNDTRFPKYITPRYPLLEMRMSRDDCKAWLADNGYPEPIKSSCIVCPFRSDPEWAAMKRDNPEEFDIATQFDEDCRELVSPPSDVGQLDLFGNPQKFHVYLHDSKRPLGAVKFREDVTETDKHECGSICAI